MQSQRGLQALLGELEELASHFGAVLVGAKDRLAQAEAELAVARSAFEDASVKADASQRAAHEARQLLPHLVPAPASGAGARDSGPGPAAEEDVGPPRRTMREEVLAFITAHQPVGRAEIIAHLCTTRPDLAITGIGPACTALFRNGDITRPRYGVYCTPTPGEGSGA